MSEQQLTGPTTACVESTQAGDTPSHSLLVISPSQSAALPTDIASELSCRQQLEYFCPGERHPISRSVHLSRLSAFYPNCRDCVHRDDMALFSAPVKRQIKNTERRRQRESLFETDGIRGVYLNELNRTTAGDLAGALASLLWDQAPLIAGTSQANAGGSATGPTLRGPIVVVGHDPRPASPDIVTGVATALRRNGCQVVDVGLTTTPCFWFAVQHLEAAAGLYVTGSRCDPSSIGLDVLGRRGVPWSQGEVPAGPTGPVPAGLTVLEERWKAGFSRPLRSAGPQRSFDAWHPYQASLWKHFHALRPLDIAVGCPARQVRELLQRLMEKLPCRLHLVDLPVRRRNLTDQDDADIQRIGRAVRTGKRHLGIVIDDDAQGCAFVDERGTLIAASTVSLLAIDVLLREQPQASVAVQSRVLDRLQPMIAARHGDCFDAGTTAQQMAVAMRTCDAVCGGGENGRLWFRETAPTCDAVLTLARILQALSLSDAPFSQVAANHGV